MNSDGNVLKLNVYCSLSINQFTKSVVNPKQKIIKEKAALENKLQLPYLQNYFSIAESTSTLKVLPLGPGRKRRTL